MVFLYNAFVIPLKSPRFQLWACVPTFPSGEWPNSSPIPLWRCPIKQTNKQTRNSLESTLHYRDFNSPIQPIHCRHYKISSDFKPVLCRLEAVGIIEWIIKGSLNAKKDGQRMCAQNCKEKISAILPWKDV